MRVATYSQPTAPSRGSLAALGILVVTILMGTSVLPTLINHFLGPYEREVTYVWLFIYGLSFVGLMMSQGINWVSWLVRYRLLLMVLMLGTIASVGWSIDAKVSAERTVHLVGSTLIAIFIGFTVPLLTTLRIFAVILGISMIASVLAAIGLADLGIQSYEGNQVWRGVFNSKNDLGFWAAVGVLLYVTLSDSTNSTGLRLLCFVFAGVCLAVLGLSHSATSLLALLIAGALSLYLFIALRFQLGFVRMVVMGVLFTTLVGVAVANIETAELVGRTDDLTGRGEVWRQTWKIIMDKPLTGYGYGAIWYPNDATIWIQQSLTDFTWIVFHAHNGFLQVASEVGLPLSVIALLMVFQQLIEIFYCQYERQQVGVLFVLAFVVAYLVSNFSEARFLVNRELFWIFFLALPISMLRQINLSSLPDDELAEDSQDSFSNPDVGAAADPGKPWLDPQAGIAASTPLLPHQQPEFADETFDATSGTMSLTDADIDLGTDIDIPATKDSSDGLSSAVDIDVDTASDMDKDPTDGQSTGPAVIGAEIDEFDDEAYKIYDADAQSSSDFSSDFSLIENVDPTDVVSDDRFDKILSVDIDEHDDLLDETIDWHDASLGDDTSSS